MSEIEGTEPPRTELPDQSGLLNLIDEIRKTEKIRGVLSKGEEVAGMVTNFIPEMFRFIRTDYPDTRQEQLRNDVNAGNLETIKDLAFQIKEKRATDLRSRGQNLKRDRPLKQYETIWRGLDGYSWEQAQKARQGPIVPSSFETGLKGANLNPLEKQI